MKFKTLIDKYSWKEIETIFLDNYPEENEKISKYAEVLNQLKDLKIKGDSSNMKIIIEQNLDENEDPYFDVSGINPNNNEKYGLTETNWDIWLKMEIDPKSLSQFSEIDCLVHCLWEMTFSSFDQ